MFLLPRFEDRPCCRILDLLQFVKKLIWTTSVQSWRVSQALSSVQFTSLQSRDRLGRRGDTRDDSVEILFQSFLQKALVSSSGMGRDVHSLMLSIQHFLCRPRCRPPSKVPWRMFFGEAVVACDMPEPCKFPSLWTHKGVDLALRPVVVLRSK